MAAALLATDLYHAEEEANLWPVNKADVVDWKSLDSLLSEADALFKESGKQIQSMRKANKAYNSNAEKEEAQQLSRDNPDKLLKEHLDGLTIDEAIGVVDRLQDIAVASDRPSDEDEWRAHMAPLFNLPATLLGDANAAMSIADGFEAERYARLILNNKRQGVHLGEQELKSSKVVYGLGYAAATLGAAASVAIAIKAESFVKVDGPMYNFLKNNLISVPLAVGGVILGVADDVNEVLANGDGWKRVPRNLLVNLGSQGLKHGGLFALGLLVGSVGSPIGAVVLQVVGEIAINAATGFVVKALAFRGKRELNLAVAEAMRKEVEAMRELELMAAQALKRGDKITDRIFSKQPEQWYQILLNPMKWSQENKVIVFLLGVSLILHGATLPPSVEEWIGDQVKKSYTGSVDQMISARLLQAKLLPWVFRQVMTVPFRQPFTSLAMLTFGNGLKLLGKRGDKIAGYLERTIVDRSTAVAQIYITMQDVVANTLAGVAVQNGFNVENLAAVVDLDNMHLLWSEAQAFLAANPPSTQDAGAVITRMFSLAEVVGHVVSHGAVGLRNQDIIYDKTTGQQLYVVDLVHGDLVPILFRQNAGAEKVRLSSLEALPNRANLAVLRGGGGPSGKEVFAKFVDLSTWVVKDSNEIGEDLFSQAVDLGYNRESVVKTLSQVARAREGIKSGVTEMTNKLAVKEAEIQSSSDLVEARISQGELAYEKSDLDAMSHFLSDVTSSDSEMGWRQKYYAKGESSKLGDLRQGIEGFLKDVLLPARQTVAESKAELDGIRGEFFQKVQEGERMANEIVVNLSNDMKQFVEKGGARGGARAQYRPDINSLQGAMSGLANLQELITGRMKDVTVNPLVSSRGESGGGPKEVGNAGGPVAGEVGNQRKESKKWSDKYKKRRKITKQQLKAMNTLQVNFEDIAHRLSESMSAKTLAMRQFLISMADVLPSGGEVTTQQLDILVDGINEWQEDVAKTLNKINEIKLPPVDKIGCFQNMSTSTLVVVSNDDGDLQVVNQQDQTVVPTACLMSAIMPAVYKFVRSTFPQVGAAFLAALYTGLQFIPYINVVLPKLGFAVWATVANTMWYCWEQGVLLMAADCDATKTQNDFNCDMTRLVAALVCLVDPTSAGCHLQKSKGKREYSFINPVELTMAFAAGTAEEGLSQEQREALTTLSGTLSWLSGGAAQEAIKAELGNRLDEATEQVAQESGTWGGWFQEAWDTTVGAAASSSGWDKVTETVEDVQLTLARVKNFVWSVVTLAWRLPLRFRRMILFGSDALSTLHQRGAAVTENYEHSWTQTPWMILLWMLRTVPYLQANVANAQATFGKYLDLLVWIACKVAPGSEKMATCIGRAPSAAWLLGESTEYQGRYDMWQDLKQHQAIMEKLEENTSAWSLPGFSTNPSAYTLVVPDNDLYNDLKRAFFGPQRPTNDLMKEFLGNFLVLTNNGLTPSDEDKNKIKGYNFNGKEALFEISDIDKMQFKFTKRTSVQFLSNGYKPEDFYFNR